MKERFRIEILDTKTNMKQTILVNNFTQDVQYNTMQIYTNPDKIEMVDAGIQSLRLFMMYPKMTNSMKLKKKKKAGKNIALGNAYVKATFINTMISITDFTTTLSFLLGSSLLIIFLNSIVFLADKSKRW